MAKEIIKSIEINIGDTTVKVTKKQAKELYDALADLLGQPRITYSYAPSWALGQSQTVTSGYVDTTSLDTSITVC
jgi:triosephosphate isomerase